jgi:dynein heavy chain
LSELTKQVRKATKMVNRLKLIALITIEVHARDITDFLSKTCFSVNSFDWKKQLRFKATLQGESADCTVEQTSTVFPYGFEYQGNNGRLVVTSLTDRCYMTLTTAMDLKKGGAPQGPAGTGKTETVKDLGKSLAKFVVVFNCS